MRAEESKGWLEETGLFGKRKMHTFMVDEYPDEVNRSKTPVIKGSDRNKPCPCGSGKKHKKCCAM